MILFTFEILKLFGLEFVLVLTFFYFERYGINKHLQFSFFLTFAKTQLDLI